MNNEMKLSFPSCSSNEGFARAAVAAFVAQLDPTIEELSDLKTAVSEAVTNCIVHGYRDAIGVPVKRSVHNAVRHCLGHCCFKSDSSSMVGSSCATNAATAARGKPFRWMSSCRRTVSFRCYVAWSPFASIHHPVRIKIAVLLAPVFDFFSFALFLPLLLFQISVAFFQLLHGTIVLDVYKPALIAENNPFIAGKRSKYSDSHGKNA